MYNRLVHYTLISLALVLFFFFATGKVLAQDYVLPYPGFMPGNLFYKISQILDWGEEKWSFGSFSKLKYHLKMTDKKLVEAKTLFDYRQYLLGEQALSESNNHFDKLTFYLTSAQKEGKNIDAAQQKLKAASEKHLEVLEELKKTLPADFVWRPEKAAEINLPLEQKLEEAQKLRESIL